MLQSVDGEVACLDVLEQDGLENEPPLTLYKVSDDVG